MGLLKDLGDRISGRHAENMQQQALAADQQEKDAQRAAQAVADRLHYENEEKKRNAEAREEAQKRASQERIEIAKAKAEADKARSEAEVIQAENDLKIALAQKQVEATEKEQEGLSNRTRIEEDAETERTHIKCELEKVVAKEETLQTKITAERDVEIAKSADEASVRIREQQRLENQFLESEITKRGELTLEYMKEELKQLDRERERKHLEFEKLIDSTRQRQKELQASFDETGKIELIEQISECETTLKQYISQDKRDEKQYNSNKLLINERIDQLFITSDSGANE